MIQAGDPNTKDPESDRSLWGSGGPGYTINEEFNTIQHDRGVISMARQDHPDSAGSQFFIMHRNSNFLDGQYTAFGRLVPGLPHALDIVASLKTDEGNAPLDVSRATIIKATILDSFSTADFGSPDRNVSITKQIKVAGGHTVNYYNYLHSVSFDVPYRWALSGEEAGDYLNIILEPSLLEHNVQLQIQETGFTPQVLIVSEEADPGISAGVSTAFFSIKEGEEPKILSNYVFENKDGMKAHLLVTTQDYQTPTGTLQFKVMQLHFLSSELSYSLIYVNLTDWFRYEINAFVQTVNNFEVLIDGELQPINFGRDPIFLQLVADAKAKVDPESLPEGYESKIPGLTGTENGGCLIATAAYGSELASQVQQLRELRDNTVLQTESGSAFMAGFNQFYYSFSPMIADYERENPAFRETVKLILTPLLTSLTLLQYVDIDSESEMLGYGISVILLNIGIYFVAPAVLITKIRSFYKLQ